MTEVRFYEDAADELLKFAVIFAKTQNKYVFCRHRDRDTWEVPGAIGRTGKISWIRRNGNCMRKRGLWNLI